MWSAMREAKNALCICKRLHVIFENELGRTAWYVVICINIRINHEGC
jgi:hypothetical protein